MVKMVGGWMAGAVCLVGPAGCPSEVDDGGPADTGGGTAGTGAGSATGSASGDGASADDGADDGSGSESAGSGSAGSASGSASDGGEGGDVGLDCTDDATVCGAGTECSCFDKTGDGTMVTCSCARQCAAASDCTDPDFPLCGCDGNGPVCVDNCFCTCG